MSCTSTSLLAVSLLVAAAAAQTPTETSPPGFLTTSGGAGTTLITLSLGRFGTQGCDVFQIDNTLRGARRTIDALHLRRDTVTPALPSAGPALVNLRIRMAHGDWSRLAPFPLETSYADVTGGSWVEVLAARVVEVPDLRLPPRSSPAPWALRLVLDTPFRYDGVQALCCQVKMWPVGSNAVRYPFDSIDDTFTVSIGRSYGVGAGCTVSGREITAGARYTVFASPSRGMELYLETSPTVPGTRPADRLALIGFSNPALPVGWCAPLLSSAELIVPLPGGSIGITPPIAHTTLTLPWSPGLVGAGDFHVQAWSLDPGRIPSMLAGSNGARPGPIPARPVRREVAQSSVQLSAGSTFFGRGRLTVGRAMVLGLESSTR